MAGEPKRSDLRDDVDFVDFGRESLLSNLVLAQFQLVGLRVL